MSHEAKPSTILLSPSETAAINPTSVDDKNNNKTLKKSILHIPIIVDPETLLHLSEFTPSILLGPHNKQTIPIAQKNAYFYYFSQEK